MRAATATLGLVLMTLSGCGTCVGASCGEFDDAQPGSHSAEVMPHSDTPVESTDDLYRDETATFEYTGSEAVLTYADEDGNIWEVRYTAGPMDNGA